MVRRGERGAEGTAPALSDHDHQPSTGPGSWTSSVWGEVASECCRTRPSSARARLGLAPDLNQLQAEQPGPGHDPEQRRLVGQPTSQDRPHRVDGHLQPLLGRGHGHVGGSTSHPHRIPARRHGQHPRPLGTSLPGCQDIAILPDTASSPSIPCEFSCASPPPKCVRKGRHPSAPSHRVGERCPLAPGGVPGAACGWQGLHAFERHLDRSGTKIVRFLLHISKREQKRRFTASSPGHVRTKLHPGQPWLSSSPAGEPWRSVRSTEWHHAGHRTMAVDAFTWDR
jgi:hypothetical protein